jgi:phosphoglycolate phosphatase
MKLLLFDIDGTLLRANTSGRRAIEDALSKLCGCQISTEAVGFSGKTDPQIMHDILRINGLDPDASPTLVEDALDAYEEVALHTLQPEDVEILPGVSYLLDHLRGASHIQLALLTGNIESMAFRKLEAVQLDGYFSFGAFGSDHADRNELPAVALDRARHHTGHPFGGADTVIIGDTARDIACSRVIGAIAVGVCTGHYSRADLEPHNPDVLLDDLSNPSDFLRHVPAM